MAQIGGVPPVPPSTPPEIPSSSGNLEEFADKFRKDIDGFVENVEGLNYTSISDNRFLTNFTQNILALSGDAQQARSI